jgi:hypothetical protein
MENLNGLTRHRGRIKPAAPPPIRAIIFWNLPIFFIIFPAITPVGKDGKVATHQNRQALAVAALPRGWQDGAALDESEKQFSFTRVASCYMQARQEPNGYPFEHPQALRRRGSAA